MRPAPRGRTSVLHYVPSWLPLSERFVAATIGASRHRAVVVSRGPFENLDHFPWHPRHGLARLAERRWSGRDRSVAAAILAVAAARRVGIVHVHFGYHLRDATAAAGRLRLPLVVSLHGHDVTAFLREYPHHYDG